MTSTDGNLAALRQYEQEQDKQEQAQQELDNDMDPILAQISDLIDQLHTMADRGNYDFSEYIDEQLGELL